MLSLFDSVPGMCPCHGLVDSVSTDKWKVWTGKGTWRRKVRRMGWRRRGDFNRVIKLRGASRKKMECLFLVLGDSTNIPVGWMCKLPSGLGGG